MADTTTRRVDSLWALVANELHNDGWRPQDLTHLEARFRAGAAEHGDDWTTWPHERFTREIREELDDITLYVAMRRVARMLQTTGGAR